MHLNKHDLPLCGGPSTSVSEPASKRADTSCSMCLSRWAGFSFVFCQALIACVGTHDVARLDDVGAVSARLIAILPKGLLFRTVFSGGFAPRTTGIEKSTDLREKPSLGATASAPRHRRGSRRTPEWTAMTPRRGS